MNIFQHRSSFYGCLDSGATEDSLLSLFKLAKQIRLRLGRQGYLLDYYLSSFFEELSSELTLDAAYDGFQSGVEFQSLLSHVLDGTKPEKLHPLYKRAQEVYEQYADKLSFQERYTNLSMLLFPLADEVMKHFTTGFVEEQMDSLNGLVDEIQQQELYAQISSLAGESMMEELNQRLKQRFIIAPVAALFAQGFTDDLLNKLTARDHETSRQMFQLLMDSLPDKE